MGQDKIKRGSGKEKDEWGDYGAAKITMRRLFDLYS